jgi:PAS domain S-box-containing protein
VVIVLGIAVPILGTLVLDQALSGWSRSSLPFHSTLEVAGAALGLVLAVLILFSRQGAFTSRRMWIACALISMAVLDIFHSGVPAGTAFVWFHSLAVLAGGVFFALVWFPEREVPPGTGRATAAAVLLGTLLVGFLSLMSPGSLPAMTAAGEFTAAAQAINLVGGGLTILAALGFGVRYARQRSREDFLFLLLCLLFGVSGVIFYMSAVWEAGWWFWHLLRFAAYLFAFYLALLSYRRSEEEMARAHGELDVLFHTAVDGKRLVDRDFNQLRVNDTLASMSGVSREAAAGMKCHEVLSGPLCHTEDCPVRQLESGARESIQREVTKKGKNGSEVSCILKATRLSAPDGSFLGVIESFWDITDRKAAEAELAQQGEIKSGQAELAEVMRGDLQADALCRNVITYLCKRLDAQTGLFYLADEDRTLRLTASYAHKRRKHLATEYRPGEGLVGQAALEKQAIVLTEVPQDYIAIESGLGEARPRNIYVKPILHDGDVKAVIELGTLRQFNGAQSQFLDLVGDSIAVAIESGQSRTRLARSLEESQQLSEELQAQQEELRTTNEELEEQTRRLKDSEERLRTQQEELQVTNEELEEKNELLQRQKRDVEHARREISDKAEELAMASKYKSEFLANMSHELRTPLNSLLLLARSLAENKGGNLTPEQVESAGVIYDSGNDLLSLINDILDLSKIEAGRMSLRLDRVLVSRLAATLRSGFQHVAEDRGLAFTVDVDPGAPDHITSDQQRVEQVIKNLVSNAIKFTDRGAVKVRFDRPPDDVNKKAALRVVVEDTGIGIAPEQQKLIFEAFQQADGGTTRRYGGTGLGLSIARELVGILGGEIRLESAPGAGSTFTLLFPEEAPGGRPAAAEPARAPIATPGPPSVIEDDREQLEEGDRAVLLVEDDPRFAAILARQCRERGLKVLAAGTGEAGLDLARRFKPRGVLLDLKLPGMDGWRVLELLKEDPDTRHIPVHIVSVDEPTARALQKGAVGQLQKPLSPEQIAEALTRLEETASRPRRVLLVEDSEETRRGIVELIGDDGVTVDEAKGGAEALAALRSSRYDCMILDLGLRDIDGEELLRRIEDDAEIEAPPVIVYTARDLSWEEDLDLRSHSDSIIVKGVRSDERLLDEVSLFLHRVVAEMPERKRQLITSLHDTNALFRDKTALLVDDDMRTLFALTKILADRGMRVLKAENGEKALGVLERERVDVVLMDIMMPILDGFETMKRIRSRERLRKLPIIALTAKAMKGDQKRCMEAGASDYLPKPVDQDRLLSMLRVWLYR